MNREVTILTGAGLFLSIGAIAVYRRMSAISALKNYLTDHAQPYPSTPDSDISGALANLRNYIRSGPVAITPSEEPKQLLGGLVDSGQGISKAEARALIAKIDADSYDGWFAMAPRHYDHVLAIWQQESQFNKYNFNPASKSKAWGIGQVLGSTAIGLGYEPQELLKPEMGARASMAYLHGAWKDLTKFLGREPTVQEWVASNYEGAYGSSLGRGEAYIKAVWRWMT